MLEPIGLKIPAVNREEQVDFELSLPLLFRETVIPILLGCSLAKSELGLLRHGDLASLVEISCANPLRLCF